MSTTTTQPTGDTPGRVNRAPARRRQWTAAAAAVTTHTIPTVPSDDG